MVRNTVSVCCIVAMDKFFSSGLRGSNNAVELEISDVDNMVALTALSTDRASLPWLETWVRCDHSMICLSLESYINGCDYRFMEDFIAVLILWEHAATRKLTTINRGHIYIYTKCKFEALVWNLVVEHELMQSCICCLIWQRDQSTRVYLHICNTGDTIYAWKYSDM